MPVECGDCQRRQNKIVGEKDKSFIDFFGVIAHPTQEIGITLRREFACEKNGLIAAQSCGLVNRVRLATFELKVGFGANDEEAQGLVNLVERRKSVKPRSMIT